MTDHDELVSVCRLPQNIPPAGTPNLWDGRWHQETSESVKLRHQAAILACAQCPRLEACEEELTASERAGVPIDGVMAGRYSDTATWWMRGRAEMVPFIQTHCRACREEMRPHVPGKLSEHTTSRRHVGEGMCDQCYPHFSRAARRGRGAA